MYVASNGLKTAVILQDTEPADPRDPHYQENLGTMVCWHRRYNLGDKHTYDDSHEFAEDLAKKYLQPRDIFAFAKDGLLDSFRLSEVESFTDRPHYHLEFHTYPTKHWEPTGWVCGQDLELITSGGQDLEDLVEFGFNTKALLDLLDASGQVAILPLYLYDHSVQSMSTGSFVGRAHHAEWDSGQVGFIYMDKETAMKNLALAADTLQIAMVFAEHQQEHVVIRSTPGTGLTDLGKTLEDAGYAPITDAAHIKNLYGSCGNIENPNGEPLINSAKLELGGFFKKDRTLYEFDGWNEDGSVRLHSVASFNPDLKPLTEETWKSRAEEILRGEVATYDNFLQGEVYGLQQYEGLDETDSRWGFYPGNNDIRTEMKAEMFGWLEPGMEFSYESGEDFDIEDFYETHDFPELREEIRNDVKDFITFEVLTSATYPFAVSAGDILSNVDGVLDDIVTAVYDSHTKWDTDSLYAAVEEFAGVSRDLKPKLTVYDLDPNRDYTAEEVLAIIRKKTSLADQIAGAEQRQASQTRHPDAKDMNHER